jgi:hypothetical protein
MAMLVVGVRVIMGAAGVRRLIGMVLVVGVRHRSALSRWVIARPALWSCAQTQARLNGNVLFQYNMNLVVTTGSSTLLKGMNA